MYGWLKSVGGGFMLSEFWKSLWIKEGAMTLISGIGSVEAIL